MNEQELELVRLRIMADVDCRFETVMKELNMNGSEFSRALRKEMNSLRLNTEEKIKEVWSWVTSHLVSIEAGQKMLYDPKDGLIQKALNKVEAAVKMATDAAACTVEARKAADDAKLYIRANIFVTAVTFLGILVTVVGGYFAFIGKTRDEISNQRAMVTALQEKLKQDADNQVETVQILKDLKIELRSVKSGR